MTAKKQGNTIAVNGIFGEEVEKLQDALEQLEQQYKMERRAIQASFGTVVNLAAKSEGVPDGWQFDVETMEFVKPADPAENEADIDIPND